MEIPAGAIPPRVPRPLKPSELEALKMQAGEATPEELAALEAKFAKKERQRAATRKGIKGTSVNLYVKDEVD